MKEFICGMLSLVLFMICSYVGFTYCHTTNTNMPGIGMEAVRDRVILQELEKQTIILERIEKHLKSHDVER